MPKRERPKAAVAPRRGLRLKFIGETISELRKAVWPTRREAVRLTMMVLAVALAVGFALGVIDYGFTQFTKILFPGMR